MTAAVRRGDEAVDGVSEQTMLGPYRLVQQLGEGGMGVVHLGLDPAGRAVAIKVLRAHIAHDADARARLAREVSTLSRVQDPGVAAVLDADTEGDRPYIVTRYVAGPPLDRVVADHGPLQGEALLRVGRGLSRALGAIHAVGVIHRDLKPANVLLQGGDPVVIDFGIAHVADDVRLTMTGLVMGTPGYLSPEVLEGAPVTEATDWWGWAATLAFAASGTPPFGRGPMDAVLDRVRRGRADLSGVDPRLQPLLYAALSPNAAERPQAEEVVDALERYASGENATVNLPVLDATTAVATPPTRVTDLAATPQTVPDFGPMGLPLDDERWEVADTESDWQAASEMGPGQPDPRIGRPSRVGTLLALMVAFLGVVAVWPVVAAALLVVWSLVSRFADLSVTALVRRRHAQGRRRGDVPLAVVASPWHVLNAAVSTVVGLLLPLLTAVAATFAAAFALSAGLGGGPIPDSSAAVAVGGLVGLLVCWWGPAGPSLRRGSRSIVRGVARGKSVTEVVAVALCLLGVGLGVWAWLRHGHPDWWPLHDVQLPFASLFRRR